MSVQKRITPRDIDYSQWYLDVIEAADLAENSSVRGCMVIKPYGYAIWENIQKIVDKKIKDLGHVNAYFPLFIPKSFFDKEAKHVEGFAKESAVVTHHRLKLNEASKELEIDPESKLDNELIVRPTSETIMYDTFSRWIKSYRDLPLLINQWANVVRWEMRTRPFLRTAEFLWQEGHTAHATYEEADEEARKMLSMYKNFVEDYLAIPVIAGIKTESEKFAGAHTTYCIEAMMQDGKALQACTSHNLGDNFAKAFDIKFQDQNGQLGYVWQTSWAITTRIIGAMIMVHGDDRGIVVPPKIAPIQVILVTISKNRKENEKIVSKAEEIKSMLSAHQVLVSIDNRDYITPGEKFYEWEKKGVPIRLELGPRDLSNNEVVLVRRDSGDKQRVKIQYIKDKILQTLDEIQSSLYSRAKKFMEDRIYEVQNYDDLKEVIENKNGFALGYWDGSKESEEKVKNELKATIRCIPFDYQSDLGGNCVITGKPAKLRVIFAKAY